MRTCKLALRSLLRHSIAPDGISAVDVRYVEYKVGSDGFATEPLLKPATHHTCTFVHNGLQQRHVATQHGAYLHLKPHRSLHVFKLFSTTQSVLYDYGIALEQCADDVCHAARTQIAWNENDWRRSLTRPAGTLHIFCARKERVLERLLRYNVRCDLFFSITNTAAARRLLPQLTRPTGSCTMYTVQRYLKCMN